MVHHNHPRGLAEVVGAVAPHAHNLVVVDAGSDRASRRQLEGLPVLDTPNRGYGAAANIGARYVGDVDAILFLNHEAVLSQEAVPRLTNALGPSVGAVGPRLQLAGAGSRYGGRVDRRSWTTHRLYEPTATVDWLDGAAMLVRREAFERVSGFEERYFLYYEDADLTFRMRQAGWGIAVEPRAEAAAADSGNFRGALRRRNWLLFVERTAPPSIVARSIAVAVRRAMTSREWRTGLRLYATRSWGPV